MIDSFRPTSLGLAVLVFFQDLEADRLQAGTSNDDICERAARRTTAVLPSRFVVLLPQAARVAFDTNRAALLCWKDPQTSWTVFGRSPTETLGWSRRPENNRSQVKSSHYYSCIQISDFLFVIMTLSKFTGDMEVGPSNFTREY